jgi:hypothetical protein
LNNKVNSLSWDWHRDDNELTSILGVNFPQQMPTHFKISPLPSKINSWLITLLQRLPVNKGLQEEQMMTNLVPGNDGKNNASQSNAKTFLWTALPGKDKSSCLGPLQWLSEEDDSQMKNLEHWLKAQSEVPFQMWYRPSGHRGNRIPQKMPTTSLASFYHDNLGHSETKTLKKSNKRPFPSPCSRN